MKSILLKTSNLAIGYNKGIVMDDIQLEIPKGKMVALLGPNGAGKSTLLKTLAGLLKPMGGALWMKGKPLSKWRSEELSKVLAVVLTDRLNVGFLKVFDVAAMGRYPHTGFLGKLASSDKEAVWECLRKVNAETLAHRYFNELSDGERQKVLLARALAQEPELILLDEPTTHLDIRHKMEIMNILKRLSREEGIAVLYSLHETDLALKNCDMAVLIKKGRVVYAGVPEAIDNSDLIGELYDMGQNGYNPCLGTLEMTNTNNPKVFVVGGGGKATGLFRLLTRHNIGFSTGVLHENDTDYHVAKTMGVKTVFEEAFSAIGHQAFSEAHRVMKKSEIVVDAGFPVADVNHMNQKLILEALKEGRPVCMLRSSEECKTLYGEWADSARVCHDLMDVAEFCGGKAK